MLIVHLIPINFTQNFAPEISITKIARCTTWKQANYRNHHLHISPPSILPWTGAVEAERRPKFQLPLRWLPLFHNADVVLERMLTSTPLIGRPIQFQCIRCEEPFQY